MHTYFRPAVPSPALDRTAHPAVAPSAPALRPRPAHALAATPLQQHGMGVAPDAAGRERGRIVSTDITWHEGGVAREQKEALLGQRGCVLWFTG
jgi:adenylylsulfate kinase